MKFIKDMLCKNNPYFCTNNCVRVPRRVPNPFEDFCKLAILQFLSPFRAFPHMLRRWSKPLGGGCYIHLTMEASLAYYNIVLFFCKEKFLKTVSEVIIYKKLHKKQLYNSFSVWYNILTVHF